MTQIRSFCFVRPFTNLVASFIVVSLGASAACAVQARDPAGPGDATAHRPHAGLLRYPDVSRTHIVFGFANDLWTVPREGGVAMPLASPPGQELFPRFSPDGSQIAFVGNYEGGTDLYTMTKTGGVPTRVTYHPASETLCDWTPDGRLLFFSNALAGLPRQSQLLVVDPSGGLPERLPVPYGANGAISPDGKWLAYTPHSRDSRTWKRYRGGMATDIWLFNLNDHSAKRITDWEGTDTQPMWHGNMLYYLSDDGPSHRLNIWSYDPATGRRSQVTKFSEFDVKWPAVGPGPDGRGEIVFQYGRELKLLALSDGSVRSVEVTIPGDRPTIRPRDYEARKFINNAGISSTGKRATIEARGEIWTVPAKDGVPRNLTRTSGVAERDPAWSPDGQWIAYFSDATGEYELYVTQSDGRGATRQLTTNGDAFLGNITWSPNSKKLTFTDNTGALHLLDLDTSELKQIDKDPWGSTLRVSWAPDSRWLTYSKSTESQLLDAIWIYNVESDEKHQVTAGMFADTWPTFDRKGDYLAFSSNREFTAPIYEDIGTTFVYANTDLLFVVPLRDKVGSPWPPKSDEEKWGDEKEKEEKEKKEKKDKNGDKEKPKEDSPAEKPQDQKDPPKENDGESDEENAEEEAKDEKKDEKQKPVEPIEIELESFERRAIRIPVDRGAFRNLAFNHDGKLIYVRGTGRGVPGDPSIKIFDFKDDDKKEKSVVEAGWFDISADGKKLLIRKGETAAIVDAAPDQKLDKPMDLSAMKGRFDPREEWRQMFHEAWRVQRDYFYDPNMHGVDWPALRRQYGAMLADCASREDLDFVIGEMISELNVGHAYVRGGGDREDEPKANVGMLGADFSLENGAYRIVRIYEGAPWDFDARGPLSQPNVDVRAGDYLLAVNGVPVATDRDPWAAFQNLSGKTVSITVNENPTMDDAARHVLVTLRGSEDDLRFRNWIEGNRQYVAEKSNGRIGYVYVPNTGVDGQNELFRQFYGQTNRDALIIDERWNGGGQIPTRFIELLNRPITNYWATRADNDWRWPPDTHPGPKAMLINGLAGSGGDAFPYYFRQSGLGKLFGMRTWGGLVGISGNPLLIDTGRTTAPTFAFYENDGTWGVEGHGVDPDVEVIDDPSKMVNGGDPQLDAAIAHLLEEIRTKPYVRPKRPPYPDRSRMGIPESDR